MLIIIDDCREGFECHAEGCSDVAAKRPYIGSSWTEPDLATAEENFNIDLGEENGYSPPWVWEDHVRVFPCAKR